MNPTFIQVINCDDQMSCLINVNSIHTVTRMAGTFCRIFITGHSNPLESMTEYKDVLLLIEDATGRPIAKIEDATS